MMKVIAIKSRYLTDRSEIKLFEGDSEQFKQFIIDNFASWFNGIESSCSMIAEKIINKVQDMKPVYIPEIAGWFQLIK